MGSMMPPGGGGPDIAALLAQLGGGGGGSAEAPEPSGNWLVEAINAVHDGMVQEQDPKQVSMLGKIIDLLTTFQANQAAAQSPNG